MATPIACCSATRTGELVDGDEIMAIAALDFLRRGRLAQNTLVATVMSNFGLDETLQKNEGKVLRTKVGDRYVIEAMMKNDLNVGGEQSGHMIFRDFTTTGDGIVSALQILRIMVETGKPLSELKQCLAKYPQAQRNMKVREKTPLEAIARRCTNSLPKPNANSAARAACSCATAAPSRRSACSSKAATASGSMRRPTASPR